MSAELDARIAELTEALNTLLSLSNHYAELLNMHDGGQRRTFTDADAWLARLRELKGHSDEAGHPHPNV